MHSLALTLVHSLALPPPSKSLDGHKESCDPSMISFGHGPHPAKPTARSRPRKAVGVGLWVRWSCGVVHKRTVPWISWPRHRRPIRDGSHVGGALDAGDVARRFKVLAKRAGIDASLISGHSARVSMAQDLVERGADLPAVMVAGRWKSAFRHDSSVSVAVAARNHNRSDAQSRAVFSAN